MLTSLSKLDVLDGHIYWNQYVGVGKVPMSALPARSRNELVKIDLFAWFRDVLSRIADPDR